MRKKLILADELITQQLGLQLAQAIDFPCHIYFYGELGVGKTTLVRALLRGLGVCGAIKSPTYAIVEPYQCGEGMTLEPAVERHFNPKTTSPSVSPPIGTITNEVSKPIANNPAEPSIHDLKRVSTAGSRMIYHFDLYRVLDSEELDYLGWRDYFSEQALCLVEWPERAEAVFPQADLAVYLDWCEQGREVTLVGYSALGSGIINRL